MANNPVFQKRFKHITIKYYYTKNLVKTKEIKLIYKSIAKIIADGFTKFLKQTVFAKFGKMLGLIEMEIVT